jgi:peptide/nickel transport system ATP-binding protein
MIAMALAAEPDLLIADEPTTALDVTIQAQILDLIRSVQKETGMSVIFITHDLGVIAEVCDEVLVMYAGRIVERAKTEELFSNPLHPYTKGLLGSMLTLNTNPAEKLLTIPGSVPSLHDLPPGCGFCNRCSEKRDCCEHKNPEEVFVEKDHGVSCWVYDKK